MLWGVRERRTECLRQVRAAQRSKIHYNLCLWYRRLSFSLLNTSIRLEISPRSENATELDTSGEIIYLHVLRLGTRSISAIHNPVLGWSLSDVLDGSHFAPEIAYRLHASMLRGPKGGAEHSTYWITDKFSRFIPAKLLSAPKPDIG